MLIWALAFLFATMTWIEEWKVSGKSRVSVVRVPLPSCQRRRGL